jgi:four helix bundle protein
VSKVILDYRELGVYQNAFQGAMRIFEITKSFPREEKYSLTDQIRRCSRAVCSNIAEAWRKRRYPAHFVSKLSDADAEAAETSTWLDFALQCQYLASDLHAELFKQYNLICAQLTKMMANPDQWCRTARGEE